MSEHDIIDVIESFTRAASDAQRLGFDGVEIHGAHGFVIDSFFWHETNKRRDRYGGSFVNRVRFACEVVQSIRTAVGLAFPIGFRLSQWKEADYEARVAGTPDELARWVEPLCDAGVDLFHCSTRRFWEREFPGSDLNLAGWVKHITGKPTITVGSVGLSEDLWTSFGGRDVSSTKAEGLRELLRRLAANEFDLVAVGRAVLADPQWPAKVREGRYHDLRPFNKDELAYLS